MQRHKHQTVKCKRSHKIGEKSTQIKIKRNLKKHQIWGHTTHSLLLNCLRQWVKKRMGKLLWIKPRDLRLLKRILLYHQRNIRLFKSGEVKWMESKRFNVMDMSRYQRVWVKAYTIEMIQGDTIFLARYYYLVYMFFITYYCFVKYLILIGWLKSVTTFNIDTT